MSKLPRIIAIFLVVSGVVMIAAGATTYYLVHRELADEKIVVSEDAENFAGKDVGGPFTAYSQATVIKKHATEIADGQTYAQLERDDPRRDTVMTASFLRASLFTSVVAFGVAALVVGLGVLFILVGIAIIAMTRRADVVAVAPAGAVVAAPPPDPVEPVLVAPETAPDVAPPEAAPPPTPPLTVDEEPPPAEPTDPPPAV